MEEASFSKDAHITYLKRSFGKDFHYGYKKEVLIKQERDQQLLKNSLDLALVFRSVMFFSIIFIIVILPSGIIFFALLLACIPQTFCGIEFLPMHGYLGRGQTS